MIKFITLSPNQYGRKFLQLSTWRLKRLYMCHVTCKNNTRGLSIANIIDRRRFLHTGLEVNYVQKVIY